VALTRACLPALLQSGLLPIYLPSAAPALWYALFVPSCGLVVGRAPGCRAVPVSRRRASAASAGLRNGLQNTRRYLAACGARLDGKPCLPYRRSTDVPYVKFCLPGGWAAAGITLRVGGILPLPAICCCRTTLGYYPAATMVFGTTYQAHGGEISSASPLFTICVPSISRAGASTRTRIGAVRCMAGDAAPRRGHGGRTFSQWTWLCFYITGDVAPVKLCR